MSVGPLGGVLGSVAGSQNAQTQGSEAERTKADGATQARQKDVAQRVEQSSGVGQTQEDQGASERDADGRRLWEAPPPNDEDQEATDPATGLPTAKSKDATGESGGNLDLSG